MTAPWLERLDDDDVRTILHEWGGECGSCDAGLPMNCTCPMEDPAPIIVALANEVRRLRVVVAAHTRTGIEWMRAKNHTIIDPDGWRLNDGVHIHTTYITEAEYERRYAMSTVDLRPERTAP